MFVTDRVTHVRQVTGEALRRLEPLDGDLADTLDITFAGMTNLDVRSPTSRWTFISRLPRRYSNMRRSNRR
jgi:hypothetical protein